MIQASVSKPYASLFGAFGKTQFGIVQAAQALGTSKGTAKVVLSRLVAAKNAFSAGRGKYVLLKPDSYVRLALLSKKNEKLARLGFLAFEKFPLLEMLLFYGSQATLTADRFSDFDVLIVLPDAVPEGERLEFKKRAEKSLGAKLHLTVFSRKGYESFALSEPFLRFWLSEGMVFDEAGIRKPLPSIAKLGFEESLRTAEVYLEASRKEGNALKKRGFLATSLEMLLMLESALVQDFDYAEVKTRLQELAGKALLEALRRGSSLGYPLPAAALLSAVVQKKLREVTSSVKRMSGNHSDELWRKALQG